MLIRLSIVLLLLLPIVVTRGLMVQQAVPTVPSGFSVDVIFSGLYDPTSMAWGPDGNLYISQQSGEVIKIIMGPNNSPTGSLVLAKVPFALLGLALVGQDMFVSYTGAVAKLTVRNGSVSSTETILNGLPHGRHQNDEIIYGNDDFLYMGIGSTGDRTNGNDPRSATIVRFKPDGTEFEIFAKGLRNPYGLAFDKDGNLFATDNGPDDPVAPDELDFVVRGGDYGFPNYYGTPPPETGKIGPVVNLQNHSSSDGFTFYYGTRFPAEYVDNAFIAQWGANSGDPGIGKRIVRVPITRTADGFVGQEIVFATGFDHPIDVVEDHEGGLLVADYGSGQIYRISYGQASLSQSTIISATSSTGTALTTLETLPLEFLLLGIVVVLSIVVIVTRWRSRKRAETH